MLFLKLLITIKPCQSFDDTVLISVYSTSKLVSECRVAAQSKAVAGASGKIYQLAIQYLVAQVGPTFHPRNSVLRLATQKSSCKI